MITPAPRVKREEGLPARVTVFEVGPRDGLQAEADVIPAAVKAQLCRRLYTAGVRDLEITSFVPASWIPQLADAEEVVREVDVPDGARAVGLVPNVRGLQRALDSGIRDVSVVVSATESFARANLNTTRPEIAHGPHIAGCAPSWCGRTPVAQSNVVGPFSVASFFRREGAIK
ncbi:MAG: hypothetical protein ABS61_00180 [Microbacterium sp. SCN 70-18]|nr:hypothetical protein [Microbacterium chocolatum]ODT12204.1 MAG: hypothetical protein ABS61_00180 [Microbacterium sp. SCN 70-18]